MEVLVLRGPTLGPVKVESDIADVFIDSITEPWVCTQIYKDFTLKPVVRTLTLNPPVPTPMWLSPISRYCSIILLCCLVRLFLSHKGVFSPNPIRGMLESG